VKGLERAKLRLAMAEEILVHKSARHLANEGMVQFTRESALPRPGELTVGRGWVGRLSGELGEQGILVDYPSTRETLLDRYSLPAYPNISSSRSSSALICTEFASPKSG